MKSQVKTLVWAVVLASGMGLSHAAVQFGLSSGDTGSHFYQAAGRYYRVAPARVTWVRERILSDEELPVVLFIAKRAKVSTEDVVDYRLQRRPWRDVARHFGLGPDAFYVEMSQANGPYGRPYKKFKKYRRDRWGKVKLSDEDIVNLVNLRFLSEHYKVSSDRIAQWRTDGRRFAEMDRDLRHPKNRMADKVDRRKDDRQDTRNNR